jgi:prevent-host-death family protein
MTQLVPVSEAKAKLTALVRDSEAENVVIMNHGRPAAVLLGARRYDELMERLDDLEDRLSVHEAEGVTIDRDKLMAELGL